MIKLEGFTESDKINITEPITNNYGSIPNNKFISNFIQKIKDNKSGAVRALITILACIAYIIFLLIVLIDSIISIKSNPIPDPYLKNITCNVNSGNYYLHFPKGGFSYMVDFNTSTMQANFVKYISTSGGNSCKNCKFNKDPYNIDILNTSDYTNTDFDRGHLVPNADFGIFTFYMPNVVPMYPGFNRGIWKDSETFIRSNYLGKTIYKGCEYNYSNYVISQYTNILYIPIGCYYIIIDETIENDTLINYGYYSVDGNFHKKLPYWINCS